MTIGTRNMSAMKAGKCPWVEWMTLGHEFQNTRSCTKKELYKVFAHRLTEVLSEIWQRLNENHKEKAKNRNSTIQLGLDLVIL